MITADAGPNNCKLEKYKSSRSEALGMHIHVQIGGARIFPASRVRYQHSMPSVHESSYHEKQWFPIDTPLERKSYKPTKHKQTSKELSKQTNRSLRFYQESRNTFARVHVGVRVQFHPSPQCLYLKHTVLCSTKGMFLDILFVVF